MDAQERTSLMKKLAAEIRDMSNKVIPPKAFIYMNHFIKEKKVTDPVITVQYEGNKNVVYSNCVELHDDAGRCLVRIVFDPDGLPNAPFHHVRAWVETRLNVRLR